MKVKFKISMMSVLFVILMCFGLVESKYFLLAKGESVTLNSIPLSSFEVNPYTYTPSIQDLGDDKKLLEVAHGEKDVKDKVAIFTTNYHYKTTKHMSKGDRVEYVIKDNKVVSKNKITGNQSTYIPSAGYVISLPSNYLNANTIANVGDSAYIKGIESPDKFVEDVKDDGCRIVVNKFNGTRSEPGVVYYDYTWGKFTSTNQWGTEMVATLNMETYNFEVTRFRKLSEGDSKGIPIPNQSFVLSSYNDPYRGYTHEGVKFNIGSELKIVGFDYIKLQSTSTYTYNFINPDAKSNPNGLDEKGEPYPAFRGVDQLNIYTDAWGDKTGANEWGFEVAVDNTGVIVEKGVTVSKIPSGGYAISGHGKGRDFLQASAPVGAKASYDVAKKKVKIETTPESYIVNTENELKSAKAIVDMMVDRMYDVDANGAEAIFNKANETLKTLREFKSKLDDNTLSSNEKFTILVQFNNYLIEIQEQTDKLTAMASGSNVISARALWHRPKEHSLEEIRQTIKELQACNFNMVFLETFWNGYSMYPSKYVDYHYQFNSFSYGSYGKDYLKAFIGEAHKANIEVHAWVESFYVAIESVPMSNILSDHPEWTLYAGDGNKEQKREGGKYIFADPANIEVQNFLLDYFNEMLTTYDLDGMQLDYIRYPVSSLSNKVGSNGRVETNLNYDNGYTPYAAKDFLIKSNLMSEEQLKGRDAVKELKKKLNASYNKKYEETQKMWQDYKTNVITDFVKKIYDMKSKLDSNDRYINLSTSVFVSQTDAIIKKNQDWKSWFLNGWIDIACPMAYYNDANEVLRNVKEMVRLTEGMAYNYAGIAPTYKGLPVIQNTLQAEACLNAGAFGSSIFASQNVLGLTDVSNVLANGTHAKKAVTPHAPLKDILEISFDDILGKANRIYIPRGVMKKEQYDALKARLDEIKALPTSSSQDIVNDMYLIDKLIDDARDFASGQANRRIKDDLQYLYNLLDYKLTRSLIINKEWNPETDKLRPTINENISSKDPEVEPSDTPSEIPSDDPTINDNTNNKGNTNGLIIALTVSGVIIVSILVAILVILKLKKRGK